MPLTDTQELLKVATEVIQDPDVVMDPYDMSFLWMSEKSRRISGDNLIGQPIAHYARDKEGVHDFGKVDEDSGVVHGVREKQVILKLQSGGEMEATLQYSVFEFDHRPYLVGRLKDVEA